MAQRLIPLGRSLDPRLRELAAMHDTVFAASFGDYVDQQCVPVNDVVGSLTGGAGIWPHGLELDGDDDSLVIPSTFGLSGTVDYMITVGVTIPTTSDNGILVKIGGGSDGVGLGLGASDADTPGNTILSLNEGLAWRTSSAPAGTGFHTLSLFLRNDANRGHYYYLDGVNVGASGGGLENNPTSSVTVGGYLVPARHFRGQIHFVVIAKNRNQGASYNMNTLMSAAHALYPPGEYVPHTAQMSTFYSLPSASLTINSITASSITQTGARITLGLTR